MSQKNFTPYIVVIFWSDFIQSCHFLAETYSREFATNTNARQPHLVSYVRTVPCKV